MAHRSEESRSHHGFAFHAASLIAVEPDRSEDNSAAATVPRATALDARINRDERKARFFSLMERYCRLGRLLPTQENLDTDAAALAEVKTILTEMAKTKSEMDKLLGQLKAARRITALRWSI